MSQTCQNTLPFVTWKARQVWLFFFILFSHSAFAQTDSLRRYEFSHPQMGTVFRLILYAVSDSVARQASTAAFQRIDQLNDILSDYKEDSELSRLSASSDTQQPVKLSDDLWRVLIISQQAARLSGGAFDITVGPLVDSWRRTRRQSELPTNEALKKIRQVVGYQNIKLHAKAKTAILTRPGMKLDAGGIGKGYAVDEAMKILSRHGIQCALVDGGGNLAIGNAPPNQVGWRVAIGVGPSGDTTHATYLMLKNTGVSTSGDMFQYAEIQGKRYSHVVNPFTGYGLTDQRIVSVLAPDGTTADWLSTAICVLGDTKGKRMIQKMKRIRVWTWSQQRDETFTSVDAQAGK